MVMTTQDKPAPPVPASPHTPPASPIAEIAAQLGETEIEARRQIVRALRVIGEERTRAFVAQALEVEASGGMMLKSGSRRHTLGGLFFRLMRDALMGDEAGRQAAYRIFRPQGNGRAGQGGPTASTHPRATRATAAYDWTAFRTDAVEAMNDPGEATTVKLTVIGRPGKIVERGDVALVAMRSEKVPSLPKGVPAAPSPQTDYMVLVGMKQWRKVAEALATDPADKVIMEGYPTVQPEFAGITMYATSATTTGIQAGKRAAQTVTTS